MSSLKLSVKTRDQSKAVTRTHAKLNCIARVERLDWLLNERRVDDESASDVGREVGHGHMHVVTRSAWVTRDSLPYGVLDRLGSKGIDRCVAHKRKRVFNRNVLVFFVGSKVVFVFMYLPTRNAKPFPGFTRGRNVREGDKVQAATAYPYLQRKSEKAFS